MRAARPAAVWSGSERPLLLLDASWGFDSTRCGPAGPLWLPAARRAGAGGHALLGLLLAALVVPSHQGVEVELRARGQVRAQHLLHELERPTVGGGALRGGAVGRHQQA